MTMTCLLGQNLGESTTNGAEGSERDAWHWGTL